MEWTTRWYEPGDEKSIVELFEKVFDKPMGLTESLKHWRWEFEKNPVGKKYINLAVDDDKIVGQYAVIPVRMIINGERKVGSLSLDTMVHPDYQGQGMFTKLAIGLYDRLSQDGNVLTYGFPNKNSIHGFTKYLGWVELFKIPLYARPLNFKLTAKMMFGDGVKTSIAGFLSEKYYRLKYSPETVPAKYTIEMIDNFGEEFDDLFIGFKGISRFRDSEYLNWRFVDKPEYDYRIIAFKEDEKLLGYSVLYEKKYGDINIGFIMDMHIREDLAVYLLSECIRGFDQADVISYIAPCDGRYGEALKRTGFIKVDPEKFPKDIYFGFRPNAEKTALMYSPKDWLINWSDTDTV